MLTWWLKSPATNLLYESMIEKNIQIDDIQPFKLGKWFVDPKSLSMTAADKSHQLRIKVFQVLIMLVNARGGAVSRQELIDAIWNGHQEVGTPALNTAIWQLRKIITDNDNLELIKTIPKQGYQLMLDVEPSESDNLSNTEQTKPHWFAKVLTTLFTVILTASLVMYFTYRAPSTDKTLKFKHPESLTHFTGVEDQPVISPDGNKLAFVWQQPGQKIKIYIKDLRHDKADLELITLSEYSEFSPEWSPDGLSIAFMRIEQSSKCKVYIKELATFKDKFVSNCLYTGSGYRALGWSKDGNWLAYPDKSQHKNSTALFAYNVKNGSIKQLTKPEDGAIDDQISWASNQPQFVFVRKVLSHTEIFLSDLNGNLKQINNESLLTHGLTWTHDDQAILLGSIKENMFSIFKLDIESGKTSLFYEEQTPFNISLIPKQENAFVYAKFTPAEYIAIYDINAPEIPLAKYRSTGRDMYPSYSAHSNKMAFLSTRNNKFAVWLINIDGSKASALNIAKEVDGVFSMAPRQPLLAFTSLNSNQFLDIHLYDYYKDELSTITHDNFEYHNLSWTADGQYLLMASNRGGNMDIWRYSLLDEEFTQLTSLGGIHRGQQTTSGQLYISKQDQPGIYLVNTDLSEQKIIDSPNLGDLSNWQLTDSGIYYIERDDNNDKLMYYAFATAQSKQLIVFNRNEVKTEESFTLLDGNRIAITLATDQEADIMAVYPEEEQQ